MNILNVNELNIISGGIDADIQPRKYIVIPLLIVNGGIDTAKVTSYQINNYFYSKNDANQNRFS